jgi:hypothetical protein
MLSCVYFICDLCRSAPVSTLVSPVLRHQTPHLSVPVDSRKQKKRGSEGSRSAYQKTRTADSRFATKNAQVAARRGRAAANNESHKEFTMKSRGFAPSSAGTPILRSPALRLCDRQPLHHPLLSLLATSRPYRIFCQT